MADMVLRVTPETLERKASEFTDIVRDIQQRFDKIATISSKTKGYWQGEAGDQDRTGYASYQDDIAFILRRLQEHPTDLLSMAGIYREAERGRRAGTLSDAELDNFVRAVSPMLDGAKRKKLAYVIGKLKKM